MGKRIIKIVGTLMGLIIVGFMSLMVYKGHISRSMDPDITFNKDNNTIKKCGEKPNCASSVNSPNDDHYIAPTKMDYEKFQKSVAFFKGCKLNTINPNYRHISCKTSLIGFVDDIELLYSTETQTLNYRSKSRVGYSDLGANKKRIEDYIKYINSLK